MLPAVEDAEEKPQAAERDELLEAAVRDLEGRAAPAAER